MDKVAKKEKGGLLLRTFCNSDNHAMDFLIGATLGVAFFLLVYGSSTLNVTYDSWIYAGYIEHDIVQHYAGWMFLRQANWDWPLTVANNMATPIGVCVAYTDSIPLVAVLFKFIEPLLPPAFQYFGWANFINCLLQGGFAMLLIRHFDVDRAYAAIGTVFFVVMPIFSERLFRHTGLSAQWLVLAALLLYFTSRHRERFPVAGFFALCVLAVGIHSYFVPMVCALLAAALLSYAFSTRQWKKPTIYLCICLAGIVVMAYLMGIITRGGSSPSEDFGLFSMNLNALFNPRSFDDFNPDKTLIWSRLLPALPQFRRQYDGFNYLGVGVLLGLIATIIFKLVCNATEAKGQNNANAPRKFKDIVMHHIWLVAVCICLGIFSLSNIVTFGDNVLFTVPISGFVQRLCATFRSSGRLFWPISYLLLLSMVVCIGRMKNKRRAYIAVCLFLALQLFDLSGVYLQKNAYFAQGEIVVESEFTSPQWTYFAQNYDYVYCLGPIIDYDMTASLIQLNPNVTTNILLAGRGDSPFHYQEYMDYLRSGEPLRDGEMYLCTDDETLIYVMEGLNENVGVWRTGRYRIIANQNINCPWPQYVPEEPEV